jgi:NADPH:quinone reductase-like Zn-dependent oxidoreductase
MAFSHTQPGEQQNNTTLLLQAHGKNMKAIQLTAPYELDTLRPTEIPEPACGPKDVLIRVHASSINFHDQLVVRGVIATQSGRIPFSDGAGQIVEVGKQIRRFRAGDSVIGCFFPRWIHGDPDVHSLREISGETVDGFAAQYVACPAESVTHAPKGWTHAESATLPCAGVAAWRALVVNGAIKKGQTVLTLGTGGVSIYALQIAKAFGATVIAMSSSDQKLARLREIGADHTINYQTTPDWSDSVLALTAAVGVDHVVEVCGTNTLARSLAACRVGGHIAAVGSLSGTELKISMIPLIARQIRLVGLSVGSRFQQEDLVAAMNGFALRPVIDSQFPFEETGRAFQHQQTCRHFGKIAITL